MTTGKQRTDWQARRQADGGIFFSIVCYVLTKPRPHLAWQQGVLAASRVLPCDYRTRVGTNTALTTQSLFPKSPEHAWKRKGAPARTITGGPARMATRTESKSSILVLTIVATFCWAVRATAARLFDEDRLVLRRRPRVSASPALRLQRNSVFEHYCIVSFGLWRIRNKHFIAKPVRATSLPRFISDTIYGMGGRLVQIPDVILSATHTSHGSHTW